MRRRSFLWRPERSLGEQRGGANVSKAWKHRCECNQGFSTQEESLVCDATRLRVEVAIHARFFARKPSRYVTTFSFDRRKATFSRGVLLYYLRFTIYGSRLTVHDSRLTTYGLRLSAYDLQFFQLILPAFVYSSRLRRHSIRISYISPRALFYDNMFLLLSSIRLTLPGNVKDSSKRLL